MKMFFVVVVLVLFSMGIQIKAQNISQVCRASEDRILYSISSLRLMDKQIFSTSCKFWWRTKEKREIELYIYAFDSDEQSQKALSKDRYSVFEGFEFDDLNPKNSLGFWSEAFSYKGTGANSSIILLRRGKLLFELFAPDIETATRLEKSLRN
jgi:hypothetical protein